MTVASDVSELEHVGSGATTIFDYPGRIFSVDDLDVYIENADGSSSDLQVEGTDYSVTGVGSLNGGTVIFDTAPDSGAVIKIKVSPSTTQPTSIRNQSSFHPETHEDALDRLTRVVQKLERRVNHSIRDQDFGPEFDMELPIASSRASKFLMFDEDGALDLGLDIGETVISQSIIAQLLWPATDDESLIPPTVYGNPVRITPFRYGGVGAGTGNDTLAVQSAIDVASVTPGAVVDLAGGHFPVEALMIDSHNVTILGPGKLIRHANLPVGGGIITSLAGGSTPLTGDAPGNQSILDGIFGAGVYSVRTNVFGSLEHVVLQGIEFDGGDAVVKGVWFTGFTRGCVIRDCSFTGCQDSDIAINGSWSYTIDNYHGSDANDLGVGLNLGIIGNGERSGTVVCNAVTILGGEATGHLDGMVWNFGAKGTILGFTPESNAGNGIRSQSVTGVFCTAYFELNESNNLSLGGTNGADFAEQWIVTSCHFNNDSAGGQNIRVQGAKRCKFFSNTFSGSRTQWYHTPVGSGVNITDCEFDLPDLDGTYYSNATDEIDASTNLYRNGRDTKYLTVANGNHTFTKHAPARFFMKESGGAGETWTVPSNATLPMRVGVEIEGIHRGGAGDLTLAVDTDTFIGTATVANGTAFKMKKVADTVWQRLY